jgi:hypothetical protein
MYKSNSSRVASLVVEYLRLRRVEGDIKGRREETRHVLLAELGNELG